MRKARGEGGKEDAPYSKEAVDEDDGPFADLRVVSICKTRTYGLSHLLVHPQQRSNVDIRQAG